MAGNGRNARSSDHEYFGVDYDIVWDVVTNEIPLLARHIERILENEMIEE